MQGIAEESSPLEILRDLDKWKLLPLFSSSLTAENLNAAALTKLEKLRKSLPWTGLDGHRGWRVFLFVLTEKLTPREKADLYRGMEMSKEEIDSGRKLAAHAHKLEQVLKSERLHKPSQIYQALSGVGLNEILYLLYYSQQRLVHDRIRNYVQKYLPAAKEITDAEVSAAGATPGTAKFEKQREEMIAARLNGRAKRPQPQAVEPAPMVSGRGRAIRQ
ncbi:MAG: hypothetical protein M3Z85_13925 [Acidobacteriota bacterium]|nr:hypothetical protein [Acidobacteriota bacterium]